MASEDVIELVSSDDEAGEPAPKKLKSKPTEKPRQNAKPKHNAKTIHNVKPRQNAMVHIPGNLSGVTTCKIPGVTTCKLPGVSTSKLPGVSTSQLPGVTIGKLPKVNTSQLPGVTIKPKPQILPVIPGVSHALNNRSITLTKVNKPQIKPNGFPTFPIIKTIPRKELPKPPALGKTTINPLSLMRKFNNQLLINKVPSRANTGILKNPIRVVASPKLKNLPSSITVTRTAGSPGGSKRPAATVVSNVKKKLKVSPKTDVGEVLTVELDDDEVSAPPPSVGPLWYLRPEQQTEPSELETKNNAEPEPSKLIEITIDDSPVKPVAHNKRTCEIGTELAITIDDSPVKRAMDKSAPATSDDESTEPNKVPDSRKKLEYPKENVGVETNTIEIEIEPMEAVYFNNDNNEENNKDANEKNYAVSEIVEIEESPAKVQIPEAKTPKKQEMPRPQVKVIDLDVASSSSQESSEFHPVYQSFIDLCFKLENSDDMKKIVEKKIKGYYRQVPKDYRESEQFTDIVSSKILSMKAGPDKMYLYIKDIVDELNMQRKMSKSQALSMESKSSEPEPFLYGEDSEFDSKRQRQIRKLEKTLKKLHRAIQKLEEQEVDFDDEEDSVYLLTESEDGSSSNKDADKPIEKNRSILLKRYKERMVRVHAKFCQLTNTKMPSEPRVLIDARPGQPAGPAKRLEKWVNRKVPIGTPLPFPDFHDVLRCVRVANDEDKLGWNEADIMEEARDLFTRCGKKLQRRRQENEWRLAASRISVDIDPAEGNESLKKKLEDNKRLATKKETDVFNKYADRQSLLKLEAVEIGDKEAEESPVESEDDEPTEEHTTLENKEKRTKRLKRLIQEKSNKTEDSTAKEPEKDQEVDENLLVEINMIDDKVNDLQKEKSDGEVEKKNTTELGKKDEIELEKKDMDVDSDILEKENNEKRRSIERIHSISDGSDKDELHLLQKLHSDNEVNSSTIDSSDTDTPIDISDTIQSGSDNKEKLMSDVISIENSSYSESEPHKDSNIDSDDADCVVTKETDDSNMAVEFVSSDYVEKETAQTNNDESVGNILLASSEEDSIGRKDESPGSEGLYVNLKDDAISIGDTVIQGVDSSNEKPNTENNGKCTAVVISAEKNLINDETSVETNDVDSIVDETKVVDDNLSKTSTEPQNKVNSEELKKVDDGTDNVKSIENIDEVIKDDNTCKKSQTSSSPTDNLPGHLDQSTGNSSNITEKLQETESNNNKDGAYSNSKENVQINNKDTEEILTDEIVENITQNTDKRPDDCKKSDEDKNVKNLADSTDCASDIVGRDVVSVENTQDTNTDETKDNFDQTDSFENILNDLRSNLQSSESFESTPAPESANNLV